MLGCLRDSGKRGHPTALQSYPAFAAATPAWIDLLMDLRSALARLVGLKDVGRLARLPPPLP